MSTNTGLARSNNMQLAVATKENGVVMTSSSGRSCRAAMRRWRALVPLFASHGVAGAAEASEAGFELGDHRSDGQVRRAQDGHHRVDLMLADIRSGEGYFTRRRRRCHNLFLGPSNSCRFFGRYDRKGGAVRRGTALREQRTIITVGGHPAMRGLHVPARVLSCPGLCLTFWCTCFCGETTGDPSGIHPQVQRSPRGRGVVGMGYVGLPLTRSFIEAGFTCVGFDIDDSKIKMLNAGKSYIKHITPEFLTAGAEGQEVPGHLEVRRAQGRGRDHHLRADAADQGPRAGHVLYRQHLRGDRSAPSCRAPGIARKHDVSGTTREVMLPILSRGGLKVEKDFYLAFLARARGSGAEGLQHDDDSEGGRRVRPQKPGRGKALYGAALKQIVPVSTCEVAEAAKILENVYRCVNIALVNEMKMLFDRMGIDVWEVIRAAATKPFGFHAFYPGPGLGGHCIPIDPFYLTWKAREFGLATRFIELAGEINTNMPEYVIRRLMEALNDRRKPLRDSKVLVLGLAYKKDIDDIRESPSIELIELLRKHGRRWTTTTRL